MRGVTKGFTNTVGFMQGFRALRSLMQKEQEGPMQRRTRARRLWSIVRDKATGQFRFRTDGRNPGTPPGRRRARRLIHLTSSHFYAKGGL